jgi:glycosyltransferase involved in cell wall biosynthesis
MTPSPPSRRARIGADLHTLEGLHQGSRTHCLELFSRVPRLLPQADFLFFADLDRWDKAAAAQLEAPNVRFVHMPHTRSIQRLLAQLPALARQEALDLLHTQYIAPLRLRCASAVTVHDILFEDFPEFFTPFFRLRSRMLVRHSARKADIVCSVSEFSKQELVRRYKIPQEKITVTYNAANLQRFYPGEDGHTIVTGLGLTPGEYLLTVGRLEPRKNHVRLLQAYARLPQPRPRLAIVGQRDFRFDEILRAQTELGLQDDVLFLESVNDAALPALYRHARLFVYPTLAEGFGMPVIEAMASGAPVITSNNTALPEVAGDAALLIDPLSVHALADALQATLAQPRQLAGLREKGLRQARRFDWDVEAAKLAAAYACRLTL